MDIGDSQRIKQIRDNTKKMADAFTRIADVLEKLIEPNSSEKPNNCETCGTPKHLCQYCIEEDRMWTPKTEPQTEIRKDVPVICAECDHVSIHQKHLFCELSHRTVYNAKPEWCPLPKLFIADDEPKTEDPPMDEYYKDHDEFYEPQTERSK